MQDFQKGVQLHDQIYGIFLIQEPLLIDLLSSRSVNRLKKIHQGGASYLVRQGRDGNRYEHSVGVMLLIRILGGTVEEQAAGLLHDISHTAFSHVIDQVVSNVNEDFHEEHLEKFLSRSDVPGILQKHSLSTDTIFNEKRWGILEQKMPDLCADRMDYTLRDLYQVGKISKKEIDSFISDLQVANHMSIVKSYQSGIWFARQYFYLVSEIFMNPIEIYANNHLAAIIKDGIEKHIISVEDMIFEDDEFIITRLMKSKDEFILSMMETLSKNIHVEVDNEEYEYRGMPKARMVDPLILNGQNHFIRCSEVKPEVAELLLEIKKRTSIGIPVRLVKSLNQ